MYLVKLQTFAPLDQSDHVVIVDVARIQKGGDAVFEGHQGRLDWEELMTRHGSVVRVAIQVTPFPNGRVRPAQRMIHLRLALHLQIMRRQLLTIRQVAHNVKQPVAHSSREISHVLFLAHLYALTGKLSILRKRCLLSTFLEVEKISLMI